MRLSSDPVPAVPLAKVYRICVRCDAIDGMKWVVLAEPKMGEEVLDQARKSLRDRDSHVVRSAFSTLNGIAYERPDLADSVLDLARR